MFTVEQIKSLNALELDVYRYVSNHFEKVQYMRIRELAEQAHVSTSTILRFCKKVGCNGYAELKLKMKQAITSAKPPVNNDMSEVIDFLKKTMTDEFETKLDEIVKLIMDSPNVFFIGSGMSGIVAKYGARYFSSVGKFCLSIDEPHYPTDTKAIKDAFVIVLSVSGESKDTIGHVLRLKEKGCKILSITNTENCSIAKISDYNLAYYVTYTRIKIYDITSQIPAMSFIERIGKKLYQYTNNSNIL